MDMPRLTLIPAAGAAGGAADTGSVPQPVVPVPQTTTMNAVDAISSLNGSVQQHSTALEFSVDASIHTQVVVVRDTQTGEVLMQCPSEEALRMARNLERGVGGLVDRLA